eukprot:4098806-Prymnesium_polylepis.1
MVISDAPRSRRLLDANLLEQVARHALVLGGPARAVAVGVLRRLALRQRAHADARGGHVDALGIGGCEHGVDHAGAALPLVLVAHRVVWSPWRVRVARILGLRRAVPHDRRGRLLILHDVAQVREEVRVLLAAQRDVQPRHQWQLRLEVARAIGVAPPQIMEHPHEQLRPVGA